MLFWGSGHKTVQKDVTGLIPCERCGQSSALSAVVDYDYTHLYWVFRSPKNVRASVTCGSCGESRKAEKPKALFEKIGGNPISGFDRFGGVALLALIVAGGSFVYLSQATRDSSGEITRAGSLSAFEIRLHDCFDDWASDDEITSLNVVPCSNPHDNEVFALFDIDRPDIPEEEELNTIAWESCLDRFEPFVGRDYESSALDVSYMVPTRSSWTELGDREVVCALYNVDKTKLSGSMMGSGI